MVRKPTLLSLDIEGEWNVPLLQNAAAMSGASLRFAHANSPSDGPRCGSAPHLDHLIGAFDHVIACEATRRSRPVYDYPCPRGHVAVVVGRIRRGLRRVTDSARGCRLEIIMKDNHTIGNNPENVMRWCRIAREEAERAEARP